ncbi:MAG: carboxypeptidase regulatory-like domain-containing protein [Vicinamibacterales bacterium]
MAVTDASGAAVPGATISVLQTTTSSRRERVSDSDGRAVFTALAPGLYEVAVTLDGFKQVRDEQVRLLVGQNATLPVRLEPGGVSEVVEVSAALRMLDVTSSTQGTVITEEKVNALPLNGRQFIQLALLVPGANGGGRAVQQNATGRLNVTGGLSIGGGRTNNTLFLVDGAVNTDPDYNALVYSPSIDDIAEFRVQTSQFTAEYGRAGAQVNVVTKSGTDVLRGSAFEFTRNKRFDSKPFNLAGDLPKFQRDNFGGTLGGPLVPGRLFFFAAYEQLRRREAAAGLTTVTVPTALERQGDFSQSGVSIFDPSTGTTSRMQFPNNVIPADRLNPIALAAMRALPLPNVGTRGYVNASELTEQDVYNHSVRLDSQCRPRQQPLRPHVDGRRERDDSRVDPQPVQRQRRAAGERRFRMDQGTERFDGERSTHRLQPASADVRVARPAVRREWQRPDDPARRRWRVPGDGWCRRVHRHERRRHRQREESYVPGVRQPCVSEGTSPVQDGRRIPLDRIQPYRSAQHAGHVHVRLRLHESHRRQRWDR